MYKLGPIGQRWLKGFHILFGCAWATSGITITILGSLKPESGPQLYELDIIRKFIDDILVAPTAVACLITALAYSTFTNWGWFSRSARPIRRARSFRGCGLRLPDRASWPPYWL